METGLEEMLKDDKIEDLSRMYDAFQRVSGGLEAIKSVLENYVMKSGLDIVNNEENMKEQASFIRTLLNLKEKYDFILAHAFRNDNHFKIVIHRVRSIILSSNSL